ncbi:hypothetical protein [Lysinibacillus sp. NPDC096212]|uniref:hypothetical protein n=1 Tax=Lysinibacillus sp. NPDC096212 TaxID=3364135 RepID=UPI00382A13C8
MLLEPNSLIEQAKYYSLSGRSILDLVDALTVIASAIRPYQQVNKENILEWTPLALWIMDNYYDPELILDIFRKSFYPRLWMGSLADSLQRCLCLITALKKHSNLIIVEWATEEEEKFKQTIYLQRENELKRERQKNERFE